MFPFTLGLRPTHYSASPTCTVIQEPCSRASDLAVGLLYPVAEHFSLTFCTLKQPSLSRCEWSFTMEGGFPTSPQPSFWRESPHSLWSPGHSGPCHLGVGSGPSDTVVERGKPRSPFGHHHIAQVLGPAPGGLQIGEYSQNKGWAPVQTCGENTALLCSMMSIRDQG